MQCLAESGAWLDDEDEVRRSHVGASVVARACGSSDVEALQRLYLKLRFNAFPVDGGLALFETGSKIGRASCRERV